MVSAPPITAAIPRVLVPLPARVRILKLVEAVPPMLCVVPLKVTVLLLRVKVPPLVQLPLTVSVFEPVIVKVAPELMVILLHTAAAPMLGAKGVPEGINTFVDEVGMIEPHQLDAVFQSILVEPIQSPGLHTATLKMPVDDAKKVASVTLTTGEPPVFP